MLFFHKHMHYFVCDHFFFQMIFDKMHMLTPFINNFVIFYPLKLRLEAYSFGLNRNEIKNIFEYELMHLLLIMKSTPEIFQ